ncbi:glycosyltransferase family 2 protein [Fictibacillus sp. JL2B1089]|uniref:glycosyltransferase family 2 protein n=1 Tax=Fictibacillus sp. JL2B1089 TaxID=3399565 RepID=UPI003A8B1462
MTTLDFINRLQEIEKITTRYNQGFQEGISIIIPTYKGEQYIEKCLMSLCNQTLDQKYFEIIIVINGEKDATESYVKAFAVENNINNILMYFSENPGASSARNIGIENASKQYTLFLDDDDYLSANFLEEVYKNASEDTIVFSQIVNVNTSGKQVINNPVNKQLMNIENKNIKASLRTLNMVSTISACKLVPTEALTEIRFDTRLRSGEDIVFFLELYLKSNFKFKVLPISHQVIYYRLIRDNSVSRQKLSFDFNVIQRLDVIKRLDDMLNLTSDQEKLIFIKQKMNAQFAFLNRYLNNVIADRNKTYEEIKKYNLSYIPYSVINKDLAKKLVISYCFPPYVDTSGNVMAKRIRTMNETVDVIYNKMDKVRLRDNRLNALADELIDKRIEVSSFSSFSNWKAIVEFVKTGLSKLNKQKYNEIYSRAMWPGSHFLGYEIKKQCPHVKWTAEFSDPLLLDIHGKRREAFIDNIEFLLEVNSTIKQLGLQPIEDNNLFLWCEYLPYIFADELIFTNKNQLEYMMEYLPNQEMKDHILSKAIISSQPTMDNEFYNIVKSEYKVDPSKLNLAYFGSFYDTRNLDDLFVGLEKVNEDIKKKIKLHIFTGDPEQLKKVLINYSIKENLVVQNYVHYLEFLNLTTKFDCLIVNDAMTIHNKSINPYLPSKLSDYAGSESKIWGVYEENSILSSYPLEYKSPLGDIEAATSIYEQIALEKFDELFSSQYNSCPSQKINIKC